MSDTTSSGHPDLTALRRNPGLGCASSWSCQACGKRMGSQLGRKKRRVHCMSTWMCPACAETIDKRRAAK